MRIYDPKTGIVMCKCDLHAITIHESVGPKNLCHLCGVKKGKIL